MRRPLLLLIAVAAATGCGGQSGGEHGAKGHGGPTPTAGQPSSAGTSAPAQTPRPTPSPARAGERSLRLALGQLIVARYAGPAPTASLLRRIARGEVGGVILFSDNTAGGPGATARAVRTLQRAARRSGRPPLLVMTDQEGGTVKRLAGGPPASAAAEVPSAAAARTAGRATGAFLRKAGINMDLAPVADVGRQPASFLGTRVFGHDAGTVADRACAFADGLRSAGVVATLKHFPGLGRAVKSTDEAPTAVGASASDLRADYTAYRRCAHGPRTAVMISSASYPHLIGADPAVLSPKTYASELPAARVSAITISDDLEAPALASLTGPARRALSAGLDLLLYAQHEGTSAQAYDRLLGAAEGNDILERRIRRAAAAVLAVKRQLRHP